MLFNIDLSLSLSLTAGSLIVQHRAAVGNTHGGVTIFDLLTGWCLLQIALSDSKPAPVSWMVFDDDNTPNQQASSTACMFSLSLSLCVCVCVSWVFISIV
jgi:hypothetical protein